MILNIDKKNKEDKSKQISLLAIQGPNSRRIVSDFTRISLKYLKYYQFIQSKIFNSPITISRTGYTGELGYEIYCSNQDASYLWDDLLKKGKKWQLSMKKFKELATKNIFDVADNSVLNYGVLPI